MLGTLKKQTMAKYLFSVKKKRMKEKEKKFDKDFDSVKWYDVDAPK